MTSTKRQARYALQARNADGRYETVTTYPTTERGAAMLECDRMALAAAGIPARTFVHRGEQVWNVRPSPSVAGRTPRPWTGEPSQWALID